MLSMDAQLLASYCVLVRCMCDEGWPSPGQRCKGSEGGSAKDLKLDSPGGGERTGFDVDVNK